MEEDLLDLTPKRKEACGCFCFPKKTINNKPQQEADAISIVAPDANFFVVANKGTDISGGSNGGKAKASVPMYIEVPVVIIMADTSSSPATTEATTINSISSCSDNDSHRCSSASSEPRRVELDAYYDAEAVITGSTRQKKGNDHKDEHEIHPSWYNTRHEMSDGGDDDDAGSTDAVLNALIEQAESDLQQQNSILENGRFKPVFLGSVCLSFHRISISLSRCCSYVQTHPWSTMTKMETAARDMKVSQSSMTVTARTTMWTQSLRMQQRPSFVCIPRKSRVE